MRSDSKPAAPAQAPSPPAAPVGTKIEGLFGLGLLRPGVGKLVQRTGEPQFCGTIVARLSGMVRHPNFKDPTKESIRFSGEIMAVRYDGVAINAGEGYMPSPIVRSTAGMIDRGEIVMLAGDVWCEPAEKTPLSYAFAIYDRKPRGAADPLMQLAVAAGVVAPFGQPEMLTQAGATEIDPETGEVIERGEAA